MEDQSAGSPVPSLVQVVGLKVKEWRFLFTLLVAVVLLLITTFFLFDHDELFFKPETLPVKVSELPVGNVLNARISELLNEASVSSNKNVQLANYLKIYDMLTITYQSTLDPRVRIEIINLVRFLKSNFQEVSKIKGLTVPCFDASCGVTELYTPELENIKKQIIELNLENNSTKALEGGLVIVAQTGGQGDKNAEFNALNGVFITLKNIYNNNTEKRLQIAKVIDSLKDYLKSLDQNRYEELAGHGYYKLDK